MASFLPTGLQTSASASWTQNRLQYAMCYLLGVDMTEHTRCSHC
jgi:hypothetical protein